MKLRKDMIAQNLLPLPLVEMFTTDGDLDLEDQDFDLLISGKMLISG